MVRPACSEYVRCIGCRTSAGLRTLARRNSWHSWLIRLTHRNTMPRMSQNRKALVPGMVVSPLQPLAWLSAPKQRLLSGPQVRHEALPDGIPGTARALLLASLLLHHALEHFALLWRQLVHSLVERLLLLRRYRHHAWHHAQHAFLFFIARRDLQERGRHGTLLCFHQL